MCGIAGIFSPQTNKGISVPLLKDMATAIQHRGPDEWGYYIDDTIGLAHVRLSIVGLEGGAQPIHNEDQTLWIVYNGEIYNYPELRRELVDQGHRFYTDTDTEVLLHLFEEMGSACLDRLNGQFAFAVWDTRKQELFLARDRLGIRPLHYTVYNNQLVFGSEIKAIFSYPEIPRRIDPIGLDQCFTFWTTLTPKTAFEGILELPPGHYLQATPDQLTIQRYWDIPLCPKEEQFESSVQDLQEQVRELLIDAVRVRLRADVPVGCYLSGGLDSSIITGSVVKQGMRDVRTFGIRFEESAFDEGEFQREMVSHLGCSHRELVAGNSQIGAALPDVLWHCEKPLLRTSPVPLYLLSGLVNQSDFKVVLSGEGADEIFGGYNIFREAKVRRFWSRYPESSRRADLIGQLYPYIFSNPRLKRTLQSFFAQGLDRAGEPIFSHLIRWGNTRRLSTFYADELQYQIGQYDGLNEVQAQLPDGFMCADALSRAQYLEMKTFLSNYLLSSQGDRMAMAHSVEIRLPYLDYRVVEFMSRVPARWKILGLKEKHLLKRAFCQDLPKRITNRSKHPYRAPISSSLLEQIHRGYGREMLSQAALKDAGMFNPARVERLINKCERQASVSEVDNMALIGILSSQVLHDRFIKNYTLPKRPLGSANVAADQRSITIS
jgi:asparagine synthase (glutamine-hydrolysing)